jgi:hypothetical protein
LVKIFIQERVIGRIQGTPVAGRMLTNGWKAASDYGVYLPIVKADTTIFKKKSIVTSDSARSFYEQFIPALVAHLKKKGWFDIYMQPIGDEPTSKNAGSYVDIADFVKKLAPNLKLINAILTDSLKAPTDSLKAPTDSSFKGILNTWVPLLSRFGKNHEFYQKQSKQGDEVWFYTMKLPQKEYANVFIERPLIDMRLLPCIAFRYGATGYLQWAFNYWSSHPFKSASHFLGGDPWIVYPTEGGVIPSIRLEEFRNGIEDYALLEMLKAKRPKAACKLAKKVVKDYNKYMTYIPAFRKVHVHLLQLLTKAYSENSD